MYMKAFESQLQW